MTKVVLAFGIACALGGLAFFSHRAGANPPVAIGVIVAVESEQHRIQVVESGNSESWFRCTEGTTITLNGFAATFNQLAPGQRVEVQYESDSYIALHIDAKTDGSK
jgi:hypothetical protein